MSFCFSSFPLALLHCLPLNTLRVANRPWKPHRFIRHPFIWHPPCSRSYRALTLSFLPLSGLRVYGRSLSLLWHLTCSLSRRFRVSSSRDERLSGDGLNSGKRMTLLIIGIPPGKSHRCFTTSERACHYYTIYSENITSATNTNYHIQKPTRNQFEPKKWTPCLSLSLPRRAMKVTDGEGRKKVTFVFPVISIFSFIFALFQVACTESPTHE